MTWALFAAWVGVFAVAADQNRAAANFQGDSQAFRLALGISATLAFVVALGLAVWASWSIAWWWGPVLFLAGSAVGGLLLALAQAVFGQFAMTLAGFAAWPAAAAGFAFLMLTAAPGAPDQPKGFSETEIQEQFLLIGKIMVSLNRASEIADEATQDGQVPRQAVQAMNEEFHAAFIASRAVRRDVLASIDMRLPSLVKWTIAPLEKCNPGVAVEPEDFVACQVAAQNFGEGIEAVRRDQASGRPQS